MKISVIYGSVGCKHRLLFYNYTVNIYPKSAERERERRFQKTHEQLQWSIAKELDTMDTNSRWREKEYKGHIT